MTIIIKKALLAASVLAVSLAQPVAAQEVSVDGCLVTASDAQCPIVRTKDGKEYDISVAKHRPDAGMGVHLTGAPSRMPGTCGQATRLTEINWTYTRERCEPATR